MKIRRYRPFGVALVAAAVLFQPILARAEIVSTEQLTAQHSTDAERARIQAFVERAGAAGQLQAQGVDSLVAKDRIAALSDQEVHALAGKIDSLPAGGNFGSFTDEQIIIVLLLVILVAVLL